MIIGGAIVIAVGFVLRAFLHNSVLEVMVASGISSLGTALAFAAMPTLIMRAVPITETASANGLNTLLRAIGTSTASAVVAAVFAAMTLDGVTIGGIENVPRFEAYQLVFWLGAVAALGGALVAAFIVRPRRGTERAGSLARCWLRSGTMSSSPRRRTRSWSAGWSPTRMTDPSSTRS